MLANAGAWAGAGASAGAGVGAGAHANAGVGCASELMWNNDSICIYLHIHRYLLRQWQLCIIYALVLILQSQTSLIDRWRACYKYFLANLTKETSKL